MAGHRPRLAGQPRHDAPLRLGGPRQRPRMGGNRCCRSPSPYPAGETNERCSEKADTVGQSRVRIWKEYLSTVRRFTAARYSIISVRQYEKRDTVGFRRFVRNSTGLDGRLDGIDVDFVEREATPRPPTSGCGRSPSRGTSVSEHYRVAPGRHVRDGGRPINRRRRARRSRSWFRTRDRRARVWRCRRWAVPRRQ